MTKKSMSQAYNMTGIYTLPFVDHEILLFSEFQSELLKATLRAEAKENEIKLKLVF